MTQTQEKTTTLGTVGQEEPLIRLTDSYKYSHSLMLPEDTTHISQYMEARGGKFKFSRFFGLQGILKTLFLTPITREDVDKLEKDMALHGPAFDRSGWDRIVDVHNGLLPLQIQAVPEGMDVPIKNVVLQMVNTDPLLPWISGFVETVIQQVWATTTLATDSAMVRRIRKESLEKSSDNPESIEFALHDFGFRAVATPNTARVMGAAHLVNFMGTDTFPAVGYIEKFYGTKMAGYSIYAAGEHSTIQAHRNELDFFRQTINKLLLPGKIVAAPIDTYDWKKCLEDIFSSELKDKIANSGGKFVARPDSGEPQEIVPEILRFLEKVYGCTINSKGYKVLPPFIGVIFGDSMNLEKIKETDKAIMDAGFSVENCIYGRGSGGLQEHKRDDMKWAIKENAVKDSQGWRDVQKTTPGKKSKAGRLALVRGGGSFTTIREDELGTQENILRTVYLNGKLLIDETFEEIRNRARKEDKKIA